MRQMTGDEADRSNQSVLVNVCSYIWQMGFDKGSEVSLDICSLRHILPRQAFALQQLRKLMVYRFSGADRVEIR